MQWIYKIFVTALVNYLAISEVLELISKISRATGDITQALFLPFTLIYINFKLLNFFLCKEKILNIVMKFRKTICQPVSTEERAILEKYVGIIDKIFISMCILQHVCGAAFLLLPILENEVQNRSLPFETYQPYDVSRTIPYYSTYTVQVLSDFYTINVQVCLDNLVYGFMFLICAQYDLLSHRLTTIGDEKAKFSLKEIIDHHVLIQDIILSIQKCFIIVVTPLFVFSLITFGASIFKITEVNILLLYTKSKKVSFLI